jgi:hypothetical protein
MVKFLAAAPLTVGAMASAGESKPAFVPSTEIPDVSLQKLDLPEGASIPVAANQNYWELYPREEPVGISHIDRLDEGVGLRFVLIGDGFALDHLEVAAEGEGEVWNEGKNLLVSWPKTVSLTPQRLRVTLTGFTAEGERSPEYFLNLQYNSNAQDAAAGRTAFSRITVRDSNLSIAYSRAADWIVNDPSEEDRAYAQERWGHLIEPGASRWEHTQAVTCSLIRDFATVRGTPSDVMNGLHPFRQYERLLAGEDRCWCANICEITCHALNSLDIPARLIRMRHTYHNAAEGVPGRDFELLLAGGHTVVEVYDATSGQWMFFDPTAQRLGVRDAAGHYLNFFEVHLQVNQPHRAAGLTLDAYDAEADTLSVEKFADSPKRPNFTHYAKREQRFYYFRRG